MLDWKILAASIVALLFISSIVIGGGGIRDFLSDALDNLSSYLGTSPFSTIIPASPGGGEPQDIVVLISPPSLTIASETPVSLIAGDTVIKGFDGDIHFDFENRTTTFQGEFSVTVPIDEIIIADMTLTQFSLKDVKLEIPPDLVTDEGTLTMTDFRGEATASSRGLELRGEVTSFIVTIGDLSFELV